MRYTVVVERAPSANDVPGYLVTLRAGPLRGAVKIVDLAVHDGSSTPANPGGAWFETEGAAFSYALGIQAAVDAVLVRGLCEFVDKLDEEEK